MINNINLRLKGSYNLKRSNMENLKYFLVKNFQDLNKYLASQAPFPLIFANISAPNGLPEVPKVANLSTMKHYTAANLV